MPIAAGQNVTFLWSFYERSVSFGFFAADLAHFGLGRVVKCASQLSINKIISLPKWPNETLSLTCLPKNEIRRIQTTWKALNPPRRWTKAI